jgi:NitT/TauT family transport system ATP-binding protein
VSFSFGETAVLKDFCDSFEGGKINCILGPSGSGKTTVLNLIAGLLKPHGGRIEGASERVSYVFQDTRLIPQKTVCGNLDVILKSVYPQKSARAAVIEEYLTLAELFGERDKYPHELSGGMRQRLSLIRAFAYPSNILLMDEPFKGLDIQLKADITDAFFKLWTREPRTVVFVTHEIDDALYSGDNIHIYSNKPITVQSVIQIPPESVRAKIYGAVALDVRKTICTEVAKWGKSE